MITRRQFNTTASSALAVTACSPAAEGPDYETLVAQTWQPQRLVNASGAALAQELVRNATLAPSSHNTQCWKFRLEPQEITLLPDFARRCPAVDPDNHHLFVSLGCATENLFQAALAHGFYADARYEVDQHAIRIPLVATPSQDSSLFQAIAQRQCTRADYDPTALSSPELGQLERAGTSKGVHLLLLTDRADMGRVLEQIIEANTAQMADPAFIRELKMWIRFNRAEAAHKRDGLFSLTTGNPAVPTWLGQLAFGAFFKSQTENEKIARQIRSSAGIAVFTAQLADEAHWVEVGRCYERFALQATALDIRLAFLNQPVEVQAARLPFAKSLGLGDQRPDLVVRFGRGPRMPSSLRRPVQAVLA